MFFFLLTITLFTYGNVVTAQDTDEALADFEEEKPWQVDNALDGFDEEPMEPLGDDKPTRPDERSMFDFGGAFTFSTAYSYDRKAPQTGESDHRGLSMLRGRLKLDVDIRLEDNWRVFADSSGFYDLSYRVRGQDGFTGELLNDSESELELKNAYLQGTVAGGLDIKIGRQIVVWGKSDNLRVTDILNPLDNRNPGLVDIEDLRLPVTMSRLDYYFGSWSLSAIALHEIRFNKEPVFGSPFYPVNLPPPDETRPDSWGVAPEWAAALNGVFSGWDISLYFAEVYDDRAHLTLDTRDFTTRREHSRINMIGGAINVATGNFLLKLESARFSGLEYFATPGETKERIDIMVGLEYSGITDTTVLFEGIDRIIINHDPRMADGPDEMDKDEFQTVIRVNSNQMRDRLHLVALTSLFGARGEKGSFQRLSAGYDIRDGFLATIGMLLYQSGEKSYFAAIDENDQLFFEAKYSF